MINIKSVQIRFYEELNDFLKQDKRRKRFIHKFIDRTSVKDLIQSFDVPHTEVDMILVNGKSVSFDYLIYDKDDISVYPVFESFDIPDVQHLRVQPLCDLKFICDVHLGKLAKYLRMLGIDCKYENNFNEQTIVKISLTENRVILTRDKKILKRNDVTHGYFIRNTDIVNQIKEILQRFQLKHLLKEFSRCLICNEELEEINKEDIIDRLPQNVREHQDKFFICKNCDKIFWKGTHSTNMLNTLSFIRED